MSGPTTAVYAVDPITVMLAGSAIRAGMAIAQGYADASDMREAQQDHRDRLRDDKKEAAAKGREALLNEVRTAESEFDAIARMAQHYVALDKVTATRPARPDGSSDLQLAAYARSMQALIKELRAMLLNESALRMDELGEEVYLDEAIAAAAAGPAGRIAVQRLLSRIAHLGEVPEEIASVAREIGDSPAMDSERVQLLTNELRLRIQKHAENIKSQAVQEASALVLHQSLKDLGYQVEEVSSTLFVEGGVVHFRRQGWDNYMVRMRVDARANTANFNVIRAVQQADNERSVLDHLAEDRWCAEFPALLQALEARGLHLNVTRRLEAGELPVQLVQKDKLPRFAEDEETRNSNKLQTREIK